MISPTWNALRSCLKLVQIMSVTAKIFWIWTNVSRINVACKGVVMKVGICSGVLKNLILKSYQTRLVTDEIFPTLSLWLGGVGWRAKLFPCLTRLMLCWVGLLTIILTKLYVWKISIESKSISWFLFRNGLITVLKLGVQLRNRFRVVEG